MIQFFMRWFALPCFSFANFASSSSFVATVFASVFWIVPIVHAVVKRMHTRLRRVTTPL